MIFLLFASLSFIQTGDAFRINQGMSSTPMQDMLDMIQQLMTGGGQFDRNFIKEIRTCMATFNPQLPDVHDKIWQGIIDYWNMGGSPDDPWGKTRTEFAEYNISESSYKKMTIYEPCNFASNIAYYYLLTELCDRQAFGSKFNLSPEYITALGNMFAALPAASAFMHGSNTKLGGQQDGGIIQIFAYLLHQGIMETLPYCSPILNDLSLVPRPMTSLQIVDAVQKMYSTEPVAKWYNIFDTLDIPEYLLGFAGTVATILHMNFDDNIVNQLLPFIVDAFGISAEHKQFLSNDFLPELRRATPNIDRKNYFRNHFLGNSVGSIAKLIHGFIWQESALFNNPILLKPVINMIGSALLPIVNRKLNFATNYEYFQPDFQRAVNIYPGEQWCNPKVAHAKWHVQSALGLLDLIYLGDEMNRLLAPTRN